MPYLLLCIGCVFRIRCSWSFVPSLQSLDLLTVQTLSHHRLDYLNSITTFLARVGDAFCMFLSFLVCIYLAWYKNILLLFSLAWELLAVSPWVGCSSGVLTGLDLLRHIILLKVTVHRSQVHIVFMHQHWLVWQ